MMTEADCLQNEIKGSSTTPETLKFSHYFSLSILKQASYGHITQSYNLRIHVLHRVFMFYHIQINSCIYELHFHKGHSSELNLYDRNNFEENYILFTGLKKCQKTVPCILSLICKLMTYTLQFILQYDCGKLIKLVEKPIK